jgi:hypothetical protein
VFTYYCVQGTADPSELAAVGLFLHVDAHKRSWICRRTIAVPIPPSEEGRDAFLRLLESVSGVLHGDQIITEWAATTAVFLQGLDEPPPPRPAKQPNAERDRFVSEAKYACRVNDAFDGVVLLVERIYDGQTAVWYGALDLACSIDEFRTFRDPLDLDLRLDDGRTGVARVLCRQFHHTCVTSAEHRDDEAGDSCLCHVVGIGRLEKSAQPPAWLTPSR